MPTKNSYITATDQFCGAGGSTSGAKEAGVEVKMALNHWKLAIETHNTNHPETDHDCTDIQACDPRRYPSTNILITSPECTNHSLAKGKKKSLQRKTLFDSPSASEERSRATMWDVVRFSEYHKYDNVIVENVIDARKWVLWESWLMAMHNLGYLHKCCYFNSMHFMPTPQSRDRMYVVFWKKGNNPPNLKFHPRGYCHNCEKVKHTYQWWKKNDSPFGKYKQQYVYRCESCFEIVEPFYHAAFNCIDWNLPAQRIGDRQRPLAKKTIERIKAGLEKYGDRMFVLTSGYSSGISSRVRSITDELPTQPGDARHGVVMPFLIKHEHSSKQVNVRAASDPNFTQTTCDSIGFVVPQLVSNYSPGYTKPATEPSGTITCQDHHGLLMEPIMINLFGTGKASKITNPIGCQTAGGINYGVLTSKAWNSFLSSYYSGSHNNHHITDHVPTVTTNDRAALVSIEKRIEDCHYRMLKPHEVQGAMAFPDDYIVLGNSKEKVKQLGNAVTPPVMKWLVKRVVDSLV